MNKLRTHRRVIFLLAVAALLLVLTLRGAIGNFNNVADPLSEWQNPAFESPHERSSYALLLSVIYNHSISLTAPLADFGFNDVGVHDGALYSLFPPGVVVAIMPLFLLGTFFNLGQLSAYLTVILITLASIFLLYLISVEVFRLPEWVAGVTAFIFVFGTTAWSYSITIYQHIFTTFLILAGFYAAYLFKTEKKWKWGIVAGLTYIIAVFFDYTNLVLLFPLIMYMFVSVKGMSRIFPITVLFIACLLPAIYNNAVFGNWATMSNPLPVYKRATLEELGTTNMIQYALARFHPSAIFHGINVLLFSYNSGLFVFSPILIIGFVYLLCLLYRERSQLHMENAFFVAIIFINILLYSFFDDPAGGWSYGPRYMIPAMACLALFVGQWLVRKGRITQQAKKILVYVLFCISSFIALLSAIVTNMIPSQGMIYTWSALFQSRTGSFVYHSIFSHFISVPMFFIILYLFTIIFFITILRFVPRIDLEVD